jgi:hypothetical protein
MSAETRQRILQGPYATIDQRTPTPPPEPEPEPEPIEPTIGVGQHTLLLADTGAGKTNVIRWHLNQLLPEIAQGKRSAILIDPLEKGMLTGELMRLQKIYDMRDRVVLIEPFDSPASINVFQLYDHSKYAISEAIKKVERTLGTVAIDVTKLQSIPFRFALQALFAIPEDKRDVFTLQDILNRGISHLNPDKTLLSEGTIRHFTRLEERDIKRERQGDRANEMVNKLDAFLSEPIYESMFSTGVKSFDIFHELQQGKLIIIDCSRAPKLYGQFWIEEIAGTIGRRLNRLKQRKHVTPTTLFIDEAQEYIGDSAHFARILNKAREARLSAFVALHNLAQDIEPGIMQALVQQTTVKFVARTYDHLALLCKSMGKTQSELLEDLPDYTFAYFNRGMGMAEPVQMPLVEFTAMPQISDTQEDELRLCAKPQTEKRTSEKQKPVPPAQQASTISQEEIDLRVDFRVSQQPTGVTETAQPVTPIPETPIGPELPKPPNRRTWKPPAKK